MVNMIIQSCIFLPIYLISSLSHISINLRHCGHSEIDSLCVTHRLAGVVFSAKSRVDKHLGYVNFSSNSSRKDAMLGKPSYVVDHLP